MPIHRRTLLTLPLLAASRARAAASVRIGVIGPLSGPFGLFGRNFRIGAEAWQTANGGPAVELLYRDLDGPNPAKARAIAQELVVRDKVQYLAGVVFTPNAMAIAPVSTQAKVPFVVFNATGSAVTARNPYVVRTSFTLPQVASPLGGAAFARGSRRVAITVSDYAPGADAEAAFRRSFEAAGGTVVDAIRMPLQTTDFGPILQRVAAAGADAVFAFLPAGPPCVAFGRAYAENGLPGRGVRFLTTGDLTQEPDLPVLGEAGLGIISAFHYARSHDSTENRDFLAAAARVAGSLDDVTFPAVAAFDGMRLIARMIEATRGEPDAERAMASVHEHSWTSPRGPVRLDGPSRHIRQTIYVREVARDGSGQLVNREAEQFPDQPDPGFVAAG